MLTCTTILIMLIISGKAFTQPEIIELLNTDTTKWNDWVKNSGKYEGWRSQNIPPYGKLVYGLCEVQTKSQENWIRSPFINREEAIIINIELLFTMKSCNRHSEEKNKCQETFQLMMYESDGLSDVPSSWSDRIYTTVSIVSPNIKWTDSKTSEDIVNKKTFKIEPKRKGIFIALKDTGACVMVEKIRLFYITCSTIIYLFANYPRSVVNPDYQINNVKGKCSFGANLIKDERDPVMICQPNGQWYLTESMFCHCNKGYTPSFDRISCTKCPINTFKSYHGSEKCLYCPRYSHNSPDFVSCICILGYFPIIDQSNKLKCVQIPSKPRNLKSKENEEGQVILTWFKPLITGEEIMTDNKTYLYYKIKCISCMDSEPLKFTPGNETNETTLIIDALESGKTYTFSVTTCNIVNVQLCDSKTLNSSQNITFITLKADPTYTIEHVKVTRSQDPDELFILWKRPSFSNTLSFQVVIYEMMITYNSTFNGLKPVNPLVQNTKSNQYNFSYFDKKTLIYGIKVRARTEILWGPFSSILIINFTQNEFINILKKENKESLFSIWWNSNYFIFFLWVGSGVVVISLTISLSFYCKYIVSRNYQKKEYQKNSSISIDIANYSQIDAPSNVTKVYIDPSNYEDPSIILQEFTHEIDPKKVQIDCVIGEGEFGEVCKGRLLLNDRKSGLYVAIKTLKTNFSEKEKNNFLSEAGIMGQFSHRNVIKLEGVVTITEPLMILTQYMENGSLDSFMRKKRNEFSLLQLLGMLRDICSGMSYLSDMRYVHRDLAARNILVDVSLCCKVSDFGLSREIVSDSTEGAYTAKGGLIPIRWTAPESINYRRFTSSSDVWSFGVLMWEVMSYGDRPYWNWTNKDVLEAVESGYRLPSPRNCPSAIHCLMLNCWSYERSERPTFSNILLYIDSFIKIPETLSAVCQSKSLNKLTHKNTLRLFKQKQNQQNDYALQSSLPFNVPLVPFTTAEPVFGPESSISQWLECLNLPNYKENFLRNNLLCLIQISNFVVSDLRSLGIVESNHLNKIMNNIKIMRNYFDQLVTQTSLL